MAKNSLCRQEERKIFLRQIKHDYMTAGRLLLQDKAAEAVRHIYNMKLLVYTKPLYFEAIFKSEAVAKQYNTWGLERNDNIIHWNSENVLAGFNTLNKLSWFPKRIYPFLPFLLFLFRRYFQIKINYLPPQCDSDGAVLPTT